MKRELGALDTCWMEGCGRRLSAFEIEQGKRFCRPCWHAVKFGAVWGFLVPVTIALGYILARLVWS